MASSKGTARYSASLLSTPGVAFDVGISDPAERIKAFLDAYKGPVPPPHGERKYDHDMMRNHLDLVSATVSDDKTAATFQLSGGESLSNELGNIHGGAVALIYDMCTTMCAAPQARKGSWEFGGMSRSLTITYFGPVKADMDILVECEVQHVDTQLATIRGQMRDRDSGKLLSIAEHNKASIEFAAPKANI